ncbi:MAG: hypothetical protein ACFFCW_04480 [Candidatus Hodarchaeota archaeon]
MKFFVSWTSRDTCFQDYDQECNVLVSPVNVPKDWTVSSWETLPNELFIDSGSFSAKPSTIPSCEEVLQRQLFIAKRWPSSKRLYFSHPDLMLPINISFREKNEIVACSIERAKRYFSLLSKTESQAIPVGVIHGFDEETLLGTYYELFDAGYRHFALGSIGIRLAIQRELCLKAIRIAQDYLLKPLHLFGITCLLINEKHLESGAESLDSSAPAKLAFYGTVLYGSPLMRYVIAPDSNQQFHGRCFGFRKILPEPLPCKCPVCKTDPERLISKYGKEAKKSRSIHNYFQIKWEIQAKI